MLATNDQRNPVFLEISSTDWWMCLCCMNLPDWTWDMRSHSLQSMVCRSLDACQRLSIVFARSDSLRFNGRFSCWNWVSGYQNVSILDFIGDKDDGSGGGQLDISDLKSCSQFITTNKPTPNFYPVAQSTVSTHWKWLLSVTVRTRICVCVCVCVIELYRHVCVLLHAVFRLLRVS